MSDREEQKEKDTESLRVEIAQLRSDLSAMGRTIKDRASDVGSTAYERVKESSGKAKDQAQRAAASVTHQIEERPLISVLVSFVIGSPAAGMFRGNRVSPPAGTGCAQTPAWPRESLRRHHPAGAHQEGHRREPFHRRGLPQDLGPFALFRRPQRARTGAPADAGEPPFGAAPDPQATGQGARRHHHHRGRGRPVGHRYDPERHPGRGRGARLRRRRSLQQRPSRITESISMRRIAYDTSFGPYGARPCYCFRTDSGRGGIEAYPRDRYGSRADIHRRSEKP